MSKRYYGSGDGVKNGLLKATSQYNSYALAPVSGGQWGTISLPSQLRTKTVLDYTSNGLTPAWQKVGDGGQGVITETVTFDNYHPTLPWLPTATTDANNATTSYGYDLFGRLTAVYYPGSTVADVVYDYYDTPTYVLTGWLGTGTGKPLLVSTWTKVNPNATTPWNGNDGSWQRQFFNGLGQLVQTQAPAEDWTAVPSPAGNDIVAYTVYDGLGRPVKSAVPYTVPRYVYNGQNPYKSPAGSAFSLTSYDNLGRALTVTDPGGNVSSTSYAIPTGQSVNGVSTLLLTNATDPNGHLVSYYHNVWGQLLKVRDYSGAANPYTAYSDTEYVYDLLGNLTTVTTKEPTSNGTGTVLRQISMTYDDFGHKLTMNDPDMGDWDYAYDSAGRLTSQIANDTDKICFTYDNFGRLLVKFDDSSNAAVLTCPTTPPTYGDTHLATYSYGSSAASYNLGRPTSISWGSSPAHNQESFTYDSRGRVTSHSRWLDGRAYTTTITAFDAQNRPTSLTTPAGESITIGYDWFGENSLTAGADALITSMGYNERGQLTTINRASPSLADTTYSYYPAAGSGGNESYRLQQIQSGSLLNLSYQYDPIGNITQISDNQMADTQTFSYDHLNRLITANGGSDYGCPLPCYNHSYSYDKLGNISSAAGQNYTYADPLHKQAVTAISPNQSFSYDASGNMTTRTDSTGSYSQAYDVENRLISVTENGVESTATTTFAYDANGQRTTTTNPDGTLTFYPFPATEQSYPAAQNDLFPENAANWNLENGTWNWNASQFYISSSNSNNAVTTHNTATLGSNGVIAASIRANNNKNGYLVFDYQDTSNYKYIGLDAQSDKWVFGQRVSNANSDLYIVNETIANAQWYDVKILLNGNTAKLYVNGTFKAQYSYPAIFSGGKVGFRAVNANSYFDNFMSSTAQIERTTYTLGSQTIATRVTGDPTATNNGLFYIFSDHLGSTNVLATSSGNQVPGSKTAYYPFGNPRTTPTQTITDRNFTGQKENLELGLIYYNARYYIPGIARFLTPDTLIPNPQSPQSYNRYTYTLNNPTRFTDPSGHVCYDPSTGDAIAGHCETTPAPAPPKGPGAKGQTNPAGSALGQEFGVPINNFYSTGSKFGPGHYAVDLGPADNIMASATGTVRINDYIEGAEGYFVVIEYAYSAIPQWLREKLGLVEGQSLFISYQHLENQSPLAVGQEVYIGDVIGNVGETGNAGGLHLHLEVKIGQSGSLQNGETFSNNVYNRIEWYDEMIYVDPNSIWQIPGHQE